MVKHYSWRLFVEDDLRDVRLFEVFFVDDKQSKLSKHHKMVVSCFCFVLIVKKIHSLKLT